MEAYYILCLIVLLLGEAITVVCLDKLLLFSKKIMDKLEGGDK